MTFVRTIHQTGSGAICVGAVAKLATTVKTPAKDTSLLSDSSQTEGRTVQSEKGYK